MSKRRRHPVEMKLKGVKEALETGNGSVVARRYDLFSKGERAPQEDSWGEGFRSSALT